MHDAGARSQPLKAVLAISAACCVALAIAASLPLKDGMLTRVSMAADPQAQEAPDCTGRLDVARFLRCAEATCHDAIRDSLATEARPRAVFGAAEHVDHADLRYVRLVGTLDTPGVAGNGLPRGYECELEGLTVTRARIIN